MTDAPAVPLRDRPPLRSSYDVALAVAIFGFLFWITAIVFQSTIIVSRIQPWFVPSITLIGAIMGARVGWTIGSHQPTSRRKNGQPSRLPSMAFAILGVLCGALVASTAAYRLANIGYFWNSHEPIEPTVFPVRSFGSGKGGPYLSIGSEGEPDAIAITQANLALLEAARPLRRPWPYCITLRRQANDRAVRIWLPARPRRSDRSVTIFRCPEYARRW